MGFRFRNLAALSVFSCSGLGLLARLIYMGEHKRLHGGMRVYMGEARVYMGEGGLGSSWGGLGLPSLPQWPRDSSGPEPSTLLF